MPNMNAHDNIDDVRHRLLAHARHLSSFFVGRDEEIRLMLLAACTQEPLLLVGEPGTAKSDLVQKFVQSLGLGSDDYFEYMLTQFTEPSEIMGPIDMKALKEGRFLRRTTGKLPGAKVVFLDEIFKSNSAILNTLLTLLNERKFYQDGKAEHAALLILFAATNDIPQESELQAINDRFALKIKLHSVKEHAFVELIDAGIQNEARRAFGQKPWQHGPATLKDLLAFKHHMDDSFATSQADGSDRETWFPDEVFAEMRRIIRTLQTEDRLFVSDRKVVKLYKLIRSHAFLHHGGRVQRSDLILLSYLGNHVSELGPLREKVRTLLGLNA